jgi:phage baseplate assembly protein W
MAFRIANKFPIDTKARKAVGVSLPFSGTAVFNSTYTTADQLKSNLINYFMTDPGERYMNPNFGAGLKATLFEQLNQNNYDLLQEVIQQDLQTQFAQVEIDDLTVYGNEDQSILKVELTYSVKKFGIQETLDVTLQNGS